MMLGQAMFVHRCRRARSADPNPERERRAAAPRLRSGFGLRAVPGLATRALITGVCSLLIAAPAGADDARELIRQGNAHFPFPGDGHHVMDQKGTWQRIVSLKQEITPPRNHGVQIGLSQLLGGNIRRSQHTVDG